MYGVDVTYEEKSAVISAVNPMLDQAIPFPAKRQGGSTVEVELGKGIGVKEGDSNADRGPAFLSELKRSIHEKIGRPIGSVDESEGEASSATAPSGNRTRPA